MGSRFFKAGDETLQDIEALELKRSAALDVALEYCSSIGGNGRIYARGSFVDGICFDGDPPPQWKRVQTDDGRPAYMPKRTSKARIAISDEIGRLRIPQRKLWHGVISTERGMVIGISYGKSHEGEWVYRVATGKALDDCPYPKKSDVELTYSEVYGDDLEHV